MADLVITAANVLPGANANLVLGTCGEALANGKPVYIDPADNRWKLADNNSATVLARTATGVVVAGGATGAPCVIQTGGDIVIGATVAQGVDYYLSATAGGICPVADLAAGMATQIIGQAINATTLRLSFFSSGVLRP